MKNTLSHDEATRMIHEVYDHQFSWEASASLAGYYEDIEDDMGEEIEIDPVAIACDWNEYEDSGELEKEFEYVLNDNWEEEEFEDKLATILDYLNNNTTVIELTGGGYLVMAF